MGFLAGLMIIPAVFAFSGKDSLNAGASLMFITMPKVFNSLKLGGFIGGVFFLLVLFAANFSYFFNGMFLCNIDGTIPYF